MAFRIAILGGVAPEARDAALGRMRDMLADERAALRGTFAGCPAAGNFARCWYARELDRIESDLAWLESLAGHRFGG